MSDYNWHQIELENRRRAEEESLMGNDPAYEEYVSWVSRNGESKMTLHARDTGGGDFEPVPEGLHAAVCDQIVNLGKHESEYKGKKSTKHEVYIRWQVPKFRRQFSHDGEDFDLPMIVGRRYTMSLSEQANLRKDLVAWRGREFTSDELADFDLAKIAGVPCQISVGRTSGGKAKVVFVLPKNPIDFAVLEGEALIYDPDEAPEGWAKLPNWLKAECEAGGTAPNGQIPMEVTPASGSVDNTPEFDDDIPF